MVEPNLFIVGAPKCGTTAVYHYLADHPDIFMAPFKEPHFFGSDLTNRYGMQDRTQYLRLFADAGDVRWRGEASVYYLMSLRAAAEIREFAPDARILITLREPVETMYSLHAQRVFSGNEDIRDFQAALEAEADRARGKQIPRGCKFVEALQYRKVVQYRAQLERFLAAFGRDRVKIILFDDLRVDVSAVYRDILAFLELPDDGRIDFEVHNLNERPKSFLVHGMLRRPPAGFRSAARLLPSTRLRAGVGAIIARLNRRVVKRPPLSDPLRQQLSAEFESEVDGLAELIGRDLTAWKQRSSTT
jgi:hypothetical protein